MKKKFIFLTMMLLTFLGVNLNVLNAQETITIGSEQYTNYSPPIDVYYQHAMSQQVYPADVIEVPQGSAITEIAFKKSMSTASPTREWAIYMTNYENSSLTSTESVIVDPDNLVFDGEIELNINVNDWYAIPLSNEFVYSGENILLTIIDKTGTSGGDAKWYQSAIGTSIIGGKQSGEYSPTDTQYSLGSMVLTYVNDIKITYGLSGPQELSLELSVGQQPVYVNESVNLTAKARGGSGGYSYSWTLDGVEVATTETYTFTPTEIGNFVYTCKVIDSENNEREENITINVIEKPAIVNLTITMKDTACDGWDGCYLQVSFDDGTPSKELRFTGSCETTHELQVYSGANVTLTHMGSSWVQEHSYCVYVDGTEVTCFAAGELSANHAYTFAAVKPLPKPQNLIVVDNKTQLYPNQTTIISWDVVEDAKEYNIYVNNVKVDATTTTEYTLTDLPYNVNPGNSITVSAVFEDGSESGMSNSINVQMTGTFNLTVNVKDVSGNPAAGAIVSILGYDDYDQMAEYEFTTDENGQVVEDVLVLSQWNQYSITVSGVLYHKEGSETVYNDGSITAGASVEKTINLSLAGPTNVKATKDSYFVGDPITISWKGVETATRGLLGYNVYEEVYNYDTYQYDYIKLNEDVLTETEYQVTESAVYGDLMYAVTAIYDEGETDYKDYSSQVNIKVNGYGKITGVVTDGTNAIVGANVFVTGRDESYIEQSYTALTDAEGKFELEVLPSYPWDANVAYSVSVSKYGYESWVSTTKYVVEYDKTTDVEDIILTSYPEIDFDVRATNVNDEVTVTWDAPEGATQYNVFRKDATEEVVKLTETPITEQEYLATDWTELSNGTYQYGVSAFVGGGIASLFGKVDFQDGIMPDGWINENSYIMLETLYFKYSSSAKNYYLILPYQINPQGYTLSFDYQNAPWKTYQDQFVVCYSTTAEAGTWVEYKGLDKMSSWTSVTVDLSDIEEEFVYIAICQKAEDSNGSYLDNIELVGPLMVESSINWSNDVEKTSANVYAGMGNWNDAANWSNGVPANDANVFIDGDVTITSDIEINNITINDNASVTIDAEASLTVVNAITNKGGAANLIINDGAQLFQDNDNVLATFVMNVAAPNNWNDNMAKDGWQFVASPMTNASIADFLPEEGEYDFYKYEGYQDLEWRNIKAENYFETEFQQGTGYLVSFENAASASVAGTLNKETTYSWDNLNYDATKPLANFNLLGNPFPFDMDWSKVELEDMAPGYAVVNNNGGYNYLTSGEIKVGDAFFVETNGTNPSMYYDHKAVVEVNRAVETQSINLIATGSAGKDNVIVNLNGRSEGFSKLQNLNDKIANIFVKDAGMRYGIFGFEPNTEEVEIAFDAKEIGSYTISAVPQGNFNSVILVDRVTGAETNLLTGSYTFMANGSDNHDRFIVRFGKQNAADGQFVYQNEEDLIINAEGRVQIIDVMGRMVYDNELVGENSRINVSNFENAAYVVRVINEEGVKVQKVVIY